MATALQSPIFLQIQNFLQEHVSKIPIYSAIDITLQVIAERSLKEEITVQFRTPGKKKQEPITYDAEIAIYSAAGWDWSPGAVAISSLRCVVTYLALQALAYVSLCINGTAGTGKILLGLMLTSVSYEKAQDMVEEGVFQVLTAVYDYIMGQFGLICSIFALIEGGAPETALDIHSKVFQVYEKAIKHDPVEQQIADETPVKKVKPEEFFCFIQRAANTIQEMILPTNRNDYIQGVGDAFIGHSPPRKKRQSPVRLTVTNQSDERRGQFDG